MVAPNISHNDLPCQGCTLKTDMLIQGTKIFSDASWKKKKASGREGIEATSVGIFCQIKEINFEATVFIQASIPVTPSVFQAEAQALLFAARVASILRLQKPIFLTDSTNLAKAAAAPSIANQQVP
jgi:hypothetical protein